MIFFSKISILDNPDEPNENSSYQYGDKTTLRPTVEIKRSYDYLSAQWHFLYSKDGIFILNQGPGHSCILDSTNEPRKNGTSIIQKFHLKI